MKKSIYSMLLTALLGLTGMNAWALDQVDGVYQIATAADLVEFAQVVNGGEYSAKAVLTADIDMTGADISKFPIGTGSETGGKRYTGTFDGQGHKISNFLLINTSAGNNYGMFNTYTGVVLKNFWLDSSCKIQGTQLVSLIGRHDGGGTFECIGNCADVTGTNNNLGGLFGAIMGQSNDKKDVIIKNCWSTGKVTSTNTSASNHVDCGALSGWINNATVSITNFWTVAEVAHYKSESTYIIRSGAGAVFTNCTGCYSKFKASTQEKVSFAAITEDIASGALCHKLNEALTADVWFQNLDNGGDVDEVPVPFSTHGTVYKNASYLCPNTIGGDVAYSNTNSSVIPDHDFVDGFCTVCGSPDGTYIIANGEGYYEIDTPAQLKWFAAFVNAGNTSANAKLTADLDMTDVEIAVIGNSPSNAYKGTFDGQGHEINNYSLTYNGTLTKSYGYGMFGNTNGATIKNFTIDGSMTFDGTSPGDLGCALVGWPDGGTLIQNIKSSIDIESTVYSHIGGIAGSLRTATIDRCEYAGHLNGNNSGNGLAGIAAYTNNGTITNCIFSGSVEGTGTGYYAGILAYVNSSYATVQNCLSYGTVTNNNNPSAPAAAVVARLRNIKTYSNNYYVGTKGVADGEAATNENTLANTTKITTEQLANGEACYFLNGDQSNIVFFQTLPDDTAPTLDATHGQVYRNGYVCPNGLPQDGVTYNNTSGESITRPHNYNDGFCIYCDDFKSDAFTPVDGYYEIANGTQFRWFAKKVNTGTYDANAKLTDAINLTGVEWTPIGIGTGSGNPGATAYTGIFDGQSNSITGFEAEGTGHLGLFGDTNGATIKNFSISGTLTVTGGYFGGVVACPINSTISNVHSALTVSVPNTDTHHVGGVVGSSRGNNTISKCSFNGSLETNSTDNFAGIVGYITGGDKVVNCANYADITFGNENCAVGGLAGYLNSKSAYIQNCLNTGSVIFSGGSTAKFCSAILGKTRGYNIANITNNYWLEGSADQPSIYEHKSSGSSSYDLLDAKFDFAESVTTDQLASGEITAKLGIAFRQNIGSDEAPVLDLTHNVVAEITEAGYATLYVPDTDVTIPDGVEAYTGVILNEGWLHLNDVTEKIAAEEAVVLAGEAGIYSFVPTDGATKDDDNVLKGSAEDIAANGKYVLAKPNDEAAGFYLANSGTIKAGKAYLEIENPGVKGFTFAFDDEATAIAEIENGKLKVESSIYNLAGQMVNGKSVNGKLPKSIYIVGGKKRLF